jgi:hypothetical protein
MRKLAIVIFGLLSGLMLSGTGAARDSQVIGRQLNDIQVYDLNGNQANLATLWEDKPVLLVTGSLSCPPTRRSVPGTARLLDAYKDRLNIAVIYVIDAHPDGEASPYKGQKGMPKQNIRDDILIRQPQTQEERLTRARELTELLGSSAPILVDNMENTSWTSIGGRPNSATLIDKGGRIIAEQKWFNSEDIRRMIDKYFDK